MLLSLLLLSLVVIVIVVIVIVIVIIIVIVIVVIVIVVIVIIVNVIIVIVKVQVMRLEQDAEVLSGKRTANSAEKEQSITEAEKNLTETLAPKIQQVAQELVELNATMSQTSLKDEDLKELLKKANANLTEEEQIVIPTSSEILGNVSAEINKVKPIFERRASTDQMQIIEKHLTSIRTNFEKLLNDDSQESNLESMGGLSTEIDTSLTQIRQLNVLDSQARMEL